MPLGWFLIVYPKAMAAKKITLERDQTWPRIGNPLQKTRSQLSGYSQTFFGSMHKVRLILNSIGHSQKYVITSIILSFSNINLD